VTGRKCLGVWRKAKPDAHSCGVSVTNLCSARRRSPRRGPQKAVWQLSCEGARHLLVSSAVQVA
jgi:hypothetical protein